MSRQVELDAMNSSVPPPAANFQESYPPAVAAPYSGYQPAIIASGYPPPPPPLSIPGVIVISNLQQQVPRGVMVEPPIWDFNYGCMVCQKLQQPAGDQFSVVATAATDYSPFIRAYYCSRALLPFLLNGYYQLEWPQNHGLSAFTSQSDLERVCDEVRVMQEEQFKLTKRSKRLYHFLMVVGDALIIIGLIVWIMGAWPAFIAILLGIATEMVNKWYVERKCRFSCEQLSYRLAETLHSRAQNIMNQSIVITVGAYATYIRFSFPR